MYGQGLFLEDQPFWPPEPTDDTVLFHADGTLPDDIGVTQTV